MRGINIIARQSASPDSLEMYTLVRIGPVSTAEEGWWRLVALIR
jgi:hypothetical protein